MNYSLPEPNYSHDPRNQSADLQDCLNCKDYHEEMYDDYFCSKDCLERYSESEYHMVMDMIEAIDWGSNHFLRLDQMLYDKMIASGELELAQEIVDYAKQFNFKIITK